jgi:hypothetical protein
MCSRRTENGLSNRCLITTFSASLIKLENTLEWWREAAYYLNMSMMQNTVINNATIATR